MTPLSAAISAAARTRHVCRNPIEAAIGPIAVLRTIATAATTGTIAGLISLMSVKAVIPTADTLVCTGKHATMGVVPPAGITTLSDALGIILARRRASVCLRAQPALIVCANEQRSAGFVRDKA